MAGLSPGPTRARLTRLGPRPARSANFASSRPPRDTHPIQGPIASLRPSATPRRLAPSMDLGCSHRHRALAPATSVLQAARVLTPAPASPLGAHSHSDTATWPQGRSPTAPGPSFRPKMPIVVVLEAPADGTTMADPPGATSTGRAMVPVAMVRGWGLVHSIVRQEPRPDTPRPPPAPRGQVLHEQRQPNTTDPAQVGRVYPNHPAALRPGMRMGSNSPEHLNLHATLDQVERMQVPPKHNFIVPVEFPDLERYTKPFPIDKSPPHVKVPVHATLQLLKILKT
jgi:hypothetical protein